MSSSNNGSKASNHTDHARSEQASHSTPRHLSTGVTESPLSIPNTPGASFNVDELNHINAQDTHHQDSIRRYGGSYQKWDKRPYDWSIGYDPYISGALTYAPEEESEEECEAGSSSEPEGAEVIEISSESEEGISDVSTVSDSERDSEGESTPGLQRQDSVVYHRRGDSQRRYSTHTHWNRVPSRNQFSITSPSQQSRTQFKPPRRQARRLFRNEKCEGVDFLSNQGESVSVGGSEYRRPDMQVERPNSSHGSRYNEGNDNSRSYGQISSRILQILQERPTSCIGCSLLDFIYEDYCSNCKHEGKDYLDQLAASYLRGMAQLKLNPSETSTQTQTTSSVSMGPSINREINIPRIIEKTSKGV